MSNQVCVIGGGLAGLSAAVELVDGGASVTLLEARPRFGGATFSFSRDGLTVDNGQHVFMRCCTAYRDFLRRIGTADGVRVQDRLSVPILTPGGELRRLERSDLPAPLHLAGSVASYPLLTSMQKLQAARALAALRRLDPANPALDAESFGGWLRRHGQSSAAIEALWALISVPTLNVKPDDCSLGLAVMVFRTGLLDRNDAADLAIPTLPLSALHVDPAVAALESAGAVVRRSCKVLAVQRDRAEGRLTVCTRDGIVPADAVVVAVPQDVVGGLLPEGTLTTRVDRLGFSPIVNLHVHYDRPVTSLPFATAHGSPVGWVFDRTATASHGGEPVSGQYLTVSLSAADQELGEPVSQLRDRFLPALADLFPAARRATVQRFFVTREPHATFRASPGSGSLRVGEQTNTTGVFIAGSWTDTGWPATMEGAVRSGVRAARRALATLDATRTTTPEGVPL
ncbi:MAG TPA: hydroxysqualene dehydroxylase HpnE [Mycobacteriales bacterium]|jgi:squalene-associated FAD-dependent desaturase|nr:hydroxysqualene dehydroxylase HpnE [Mycobacteriales bacterium]